jgi:cell division protein FtsI (penicillin-binding protein 3)
VERLLRDRLKALFPAKKRDKATIISGSFNNSRSSIVRWAVYLVFVAVFTRALWIHLFPPSPEFLNNLAKHQYRKKIELAPYRGNIMDRRGEPLALSIKKSSFYLNPRLFSASAANLHELAKVLNLSEGKLTSLQAKKGYFAWLARQVSSEQASRVRNMNLPGVFEIREPARFYPLGEAASQILGFVGIDNQGLSGLEMIYDKNLRGEVVDYMPAIDARGAKIYLDSQYAIPFLPGDSLQLTLDRVVQEIAEEELEKGVREAGAKGGIAIVSDPHTGQILAMANFPKFDPNRVSAKSFQNAKNRAVVDIFEPGSISKPLVVATALQEKHVKIGEMFNCEKSGRYVIPGGVINDDHPEEHLDVSGIITQSSNICMYKIAKRMGREPLYNGLRKFGIGDPAIRLGFASEVGGRIAAWNHWKEIRFANVAFGQGFSTTGLEMVASYGAIANGGQLMRPYLVSKVVRPDGSTHANVNPQVVTQVLHPEVASEMRKMLERTTTEGTGSKAQTIDFTVAGKTGTAEVFDPLLKAYSKTKRKASFIGFAPARDPHLVIFVLIDEPSKQPYYGGLWAAPVFSQISARTLHYLNVKPDKEDISHGIDLAVEKLPVPL